MSTVNQQQVMQLLATDPQIQAVIRRVWGNTPVNQRPGDTPKNLERANHDASEEIGRILAQRGMKLPSHSFVNPRTQSVEGEHGWAGLPTLAKVGIIGGAAAGGLGLAGALGAFGGAAGGAGAAAPSLGATGGVSAGAFPTIAGTAGSGAASAAAGGAGMFGGLGIKDALQLGPSLMSLFQKKPSNQVPMNNELEQLLGMQRSRMEQSQPLYDAVLKLAMSMAPVSARGMMAPQSGAAQPRTQVQMPPQRFR